MVSTLKRTAMAVAVAGALSGSLPAQAITGIKFDPTGGGGAGIGVNIFDWADNPVLAINTFAIGDITPNLSDIQSTGFVQGQGQMIAARLGNTTQISGDASTQFTYEFRVPVKVTTTVVTNDGSGGLGTGVAQIVVASVANRAVPDYGSDNYFRIYYTPVAPNPTAGTGYGTSQSESASAGQILIFEGKVNVGASSGESSNNSTQSDIGDTGTLTQGGNTRKTITTSGSLSLEIEQCSAANVAASLAQCVNGTTTIDTNYFRSDVEALAFDVNLGPTLSAPFASGNIVPAVVVNTTPYFGGSVGGTIVSNYSCEGGGDPCGRLYDGQSAHSNFFGSFVPEPGSLALLGLGLAGLGGIARRNRKQGGGTA